MNRGALFQKWSLCQLGHDYFGCWRWTKMKIFVKPVSQKRLNRDLIHLSQDNLHSGRLTLLLLMLLLLLLCPLLLYLLILTLLLVMLSLLLVTRMMLGLLFFVKYIYWSSHSKITFVNACLQYSYSLWIIIRTKLIGYFYIYCSIVVYVQLNKDK